ncbi:MAG: hypothetical protein FJW34_17820 [Acidobacteria bacterium]|nr:hypothetical protein [Acidobacteriota bacterium]
MLPGGQRKDGRAARRAGLWVGLLLCLPGMGRAEFQFRYDAEERIWTLSNGVLEAVFQHTPAQTFEFRSLSDLRTKDTWAPPDNIASSPIRLQVDGTLWDARTQWRLAAQTSRAIARGGYRQTIVLRDLLATGQVTLELELFENQPALRYRVRFRNLRPATARVTLADMLPWSFAELEKTYRVFRVNQWVRGGIWGNFEPLTTTLNPAGGTVSVNSGAHGQHCGWLALRDDADRGLFAGWEFDGRATAAVRHTRWQGHLQLAATIQQLSRPLGPNQDFQVPAAFLGLYHGDWDEAGYRTQRFAEAAIAKPIPDQNFPYVIWDSWRYQFDLDEETLRRNTEIAARIGVELFVVDLGWAERIGDWRADRGKFPSGMRALSDYVHSLGMKFGLHFALAEADPDSAVLRANPDWTSSETYHYFDALSLCLSHQPVRQWLVQETVRMIDEYNLDWILQDGENMVKRCTKTSHSHDPGDSNYSNAVDGLNAVILEVQRQRPRVLWENCEDGGNMMTFNMVRNYVTSIAADDSGPMTTRQAIYGVTYPFSTRYADRYMPDHELDYYKTRSYMFGGPWIFMNRLTEMRPEDVELAIAEVKLYKQLRRRIREGRVYHLSARPADNRVDSLQSYHEATDTAIIFVTRPQATGNYRMVRPRGLQRERNYSVRFQESGRTYTLTGEQLMTDGVRVDLPAMWTTEIVYIEPLQPGP